MRSFLYVLIISYAILCVLLFLFQRKLLYFPTPEISHDYQQISVKNQGETIEVIVVNPDQKDAIVYFGGNAESVIYNADDFSKYFPDRTIYLVNYRGYADSSGLPSQNALFSDALVIYDTVTQTHSDIVAFGRSLGSGVALYLAAQRRLSHLVLITPYDSILAVAKKQFPFFPVGILLKDKYDSLSLVDKISSPTLIVAGEQDNIIPVSHSKTLYEALDAENAHLKIIQNAGHNNISEHREFYQIINEFLKRHCQVTEFG